MILFDLINLKQLRRALLYALCLLVTLTLQNALFGQIAILGVKAMFVPALIVAIGLFEGGFWGGLFGMAAGMFCDMASTDTTVLYTILLAAEGFLAGMLTAVYINRRFYSYMILALGALALTALCCIIPLWIYHGADIAALLRTGALQVAWSIPFAVPAYFACKAVAERDENKT